jgi:polyisoprenyl-teichoic acid--peptidoglycan teichoic acid transferase
MARLRDPGADGILPAMPEPAGADPRHPSAPRLLVLNAIFPGLAHAVSGRRRWALLLALPVLLPMLALVAFMLATSATSAAARLVDPAVLGALLVVQGVLLLWRLFAVGAVGVIAPLRLRPSTVAAAVIAVAIVVGPQLVLGSLTMDARDAANEVFQPVAEGGAWVPAATAPPVASNDPDFAVDPTAPASALPSDSPSPSPTPAQPRINVLLIGMDSGVGRNTALTDTMIVASLDPVGRTVSMASIPRDMVDVPLPDGRIFKDKINGLVSYVGWHQSKFPGAKDGQSVLAAALGKLLNLRIDMWAQVNLGGFVYLVDSVGGVNINVTDGFCDPRYDEYGINGFGINPGWYHMNGNQALAYARVRKAAGESDFTRAGRQQEVIAALRDRVIRGGFLDNPGAFLKSVGRTVKTNINPSLIADWIDVASKVGRKDTFRIVIQHPLVRGTSDYRGSIQVPDIKAIRAMAARLFAEPGVRPKGFDTMPSNGSGATKRASSSSTCGISPTPRPTAKPTPRPTPKPTTRPSTSSGPSATATTKPTPSPTVPAEPTPSPSGS